MSGQQKSDYANIESAARNLLSLLSASVSQGQVEVPGQSQVQVQIQGQRPSQGTFQESGVRRQANVQQEMSKLEKVQCVYNVCRAIQILYDMPFNLLHRSFPALFRRERTSGKRRFPTPLKMVSAPFTKATNIQFYLLPKPMTRTPQGSQELSLLMAGLGKRMISVSEHCNHEEISAMLLLEFPKLETLSGGWLFHKATGGSGQRKLVLIPPESEGYTAKLLKTVSNNGRHTIFIVPLQNEIDTTPLPSDAPEFRKMPKSQCKTCGEILPLQVLALHVDSCGKSTTEEENDENADEKQDQDVSFVSCSQNIAAETVCPICQVVYPADIIEMHASACSERQSTQEEHSFDSSGVDLEAMEGPSGTSFQIAPLQNLPTCSSGPSDSTNKTEYWKTIPDLAMAAQLYRETVLDIHASGKPLHLHIDLRGSKSDQEMALIAFYKARRVEWANPVQCRLEGDPAIGEGVNRFLFSRIMEKLKNGFKLNFGNSGETKLFDGEPDHLVPSSSAFLVESDLFLMAGRMIGHCFLHGGPALTGLSPAIVHILCGGTVETAIIQINDCPDIDLREKITLLEGSAKLSADEKESLDNLCLAWDFPLMTENNRRWLFERLLCHAVIGRFMRQIKQIRKGLKETMLWPLISERPDVAPVIFPRESSAFLTPQCILERIIWPTMTDDDDDDECSVTDKSRIAGYLRRFIQNASSDELKALMKFWVGWEAPTTTLTLEVTDCSLPKSSTCFETLRLPVRYKDFTVFKEELIACLQTCDTGFGLV
nr:uncharacterized protein LOC129444253 isoform X3 [Misgurnus anguillicaudatus]